MRSSLLKGFAWLFVGVSILLAILPWVIQIEEENYQSMRQKRWTTYLQAFYDEHARTSCDFLLGVRRGDIIRDTMGRTWVAGGCEGLTGLHTIDAGEWTSSNENYFDLAAGVGGQIWAVTTLGRSVEVFDGQTRKTYSTVELGLGAQRITQVEVDSSGRVWLVTRASEDGTGKIVEYINELTVSPDDVPSLRNVEVIDGYLTSFEADDHGKLWVGIDRPFPMPEVTGISVFDGETLQRVSDQGKNLRYIAGMALDRVGALWVVTRCGGVLKYDGIEWITIVDIETTPFCIGGTLEMEGMALDNQGRVWAWNFEGVKFLDGDKWITLTPETSGLAGNRVFGVLVDDRDRVWIGYSGGVSMAALQDARPLPEALVRLHRAVAYLKSWLHGMNWFLPSLVAILWLATYFDLLPGVLAAVIAGLLMIGVGIGIIGPGNNDADRLMVSAGVIGTFVGILCGVIGGLDDKYRKGIGRHRSAVALALLGVMLGGAFGAVFLMFRVLSG